jgi:hypothetical protein
VQRAKLLTKINAATLSNFEPRDGPPKITTPVGIAQSQKSGQLLRVNDTLIATLTGQIKFCLARYF